MKVLDAGCGTGLYTLSLLKNFPNAQIIAFDYNPDLVTHLKTKLYLSNYSSRVKLFSADIQGPLTEINKEVFDFIITNVRT